MQCPECNASLSGFTRSGIPLDRCASCSGVWFDAGELDAYRVARESPPAPHEFEALAEPAKRCPRCDTSTLVSGLASGVRLQRCSRCNGFFLRRQPLPPDGDDLDLLVTLEVVEEGFWWSGEILELLAGILDNTW